MLKVIVQQYLQRFTVMKLEVARGIFLAGALAVASMALVAWEQPGPQVLTTAAGTAHRPLPQTWQ